MINTAGRAQYICLHTCSILSYLFDVLIPQNKLGMWIASYNISPRNWIALDSFDLISKLEQGEFNSSSGSDLLRLVVVWDDGGASGTRDDD
jgi:hypothetical protein